MDAGISFVSGFISGLIPGSGFLSIAGQALASSFVDNGLRALAYGEQFSASDVLKDAVIQIGTSYVLKGISKATSKLTKKIFIKADNYSQYQHYFRKKGLDYTREEVYERMYSHVKRMRITNGIVGYSLNFALDFLSSPL